MSSFRCAAGIAAFLMLVAAACGFESSRFERTTATSNVVDVNIGYLQGSRCYSAGYPKFRLGADPERRLAWLAFDLRDEPDIVRSDDVAYFRSSSFPGFEDQVGWIRVPADQADPLNKVARLTSLGELSYTLLNPDPPTTPLLDEFEALRSRADSNSALLDEADPKSPVVRWVEDAEGDFVEITVQIQDPDPLGEQLITITPSLVGATSDVSLPPEKEAIDLADVPASGPLLSSRLLDHACRDPENPGDVESERQCVRDAVGQMTIGEWIELRSTGDLGVPPPCP